MKITQLKLHVLELPQINVLRDFTIPLVPVDDPFRPRFLGNTRGGKRPMRVNLLRIMTDEGLEGLCTGGSPDILERLRNDLVGMDPLDHGLIWQKLWWAVRYKFFHLEETAPIDNALWDLRAKIAGIPVHRLLGTVRDRIPCYRSAPHYTDMQRSVQEALEVKRLGYLGYKLHAFHGVEGDIRVCRMVREAVGDGLYLMQDAAQTYTYTEAIKVGRALEELNFHWLEEPLRDRDLYGLQKLCQDLDIPIATSETEGEDYQAIAQHILFRAGDIVRTDTNRAGITTIMRIAHTAESFGLNVELTSMGACFGLGNVQASMAIPNTTFYEDWDNQHPLMEALGCKHIMRSHNGYIQPPDAPGFGLELDWDRVKELTVEEC